MQLRQFVALVALCAIGMVQLHAQIHFTASLSGAQENPAVVTSATGTGSFILSDDFTELRYVVTYQGLSGTLTAGGHFHVGPVGKNGGVVKSIAFSGGAAAATISGSWKTTDATQPLTQALVESLLTGRMYVNFHTAANPGGEIRGQVDLATPLHFTADLGGAQEVPANATAGTGTGVFTLTTDRSELAYAVAYQGLTGPLTAGGHFHVGAAGKNGGVVRNIATSGDSASAFIKGNWKTSDGTQPLTSALVDSLVAGKLYVNFHTSSFGGGEVRGQVTLAGGAGFMAQLEASKEVPPNSTGGKGLAYVVLNAARTEAKYAVTYFKVTGSLTGGHFHAAGAGRNGSVVKAIASAGGAASGTLSGTWKSSDATNALTTALVESLLTGRTYVNFHTATNPGGEIRGQVDLTTGYGFTVRLDGSQEVPALSVTGSGSGFAVITPERKDIRYGFTYFGLTGTLSAGGHFHTGITGKTGPVVRNIATSGGAASATVQDNWSSSALTQPLTDALVDSLFAGKLYVNFHTTANAGGEIRGQVGFGTFGPTSVEQTSSVVPASFELAQNYPNPFNPSTIVSYQLPVAGSVKLVVYDLVGREVATLVNESQRPGSYSVPFNATGLSSGVYFYRLSTSAGFSEARRMMLLK